MQHSIVLLKGKLYKSIKLESKNIMQHTEYSNMTPEIKVGTLKVSLILMHLKMHLKIKKKQLIFRKN